MVTQDQDTSPDGRIARQAFWLAAVSATQLLGGLVQVVIVVRILAPAGYGTLAVIVAVCAMVHGLLSTPGGNTIITYVSRSVAEGRLDEAANTIRFALATSLGLSLIAYSVLATLALVAADWLGLESQHVSAALAYGVVGVLLAMHSESLAILRLAERVESAFYATLVAALVHIGALVAVWSVGGTLLGVVYAMVAGAAANGGLLFVLAAHNARRVGVTGLLGSRTVQVRPDVVRFHVGIFGTSTLTHLSNNIDTLLVAHFAGVAETGLYRAARQLVDTARAPFAPIGRSLQVEFSKQWYAFDGAAMRRTTARYAIFIAGAALVLFTVVAVLVDVLVAVLYGAAFAKVGPLALIMVPASFVVSCFAGVSTLPHATGRVAPMLLAHAAALAASSMTLLTLVPTYGATGGAWAFLTFALTWGGVLSPYIAGTLRRSYDRQAEPAGERP